MLRSTPSLLYTGRLALEPFAAQPQHMLQTKGVGSMPLICDLPDRREPDTQFGTRLVENRSCRDRCLLAAGVANVLIDPAR